MVLIINHMPMASTGEPGKDIDIQPKKSRWRSVHWGLGPSNNGESQNLSYKYNHKSTTLTLAQTQNHSYDNNLTQ